MNIEDAKKMLLDFLLLSAMLFGMVSLLFTAALLLKFTLQLIGVI